MSLFFRLFTMILLLDSAWPLPWGWIGVELVILISRLPHKFWVILITYRLWTIITYKFIWDAKPSQDAALYEGYHIFFSNLIGQRLQLLYIWRNNQSLLAWKFYHIVLWEVFQQWDIIRCIGQASLCKILLCMWHASNFLGHFIASFFIVRQ